MSYLYIGAHLPFSRVPQAGQVIAANNLSNLHEKYGKGLSLLFYNRLESDWVEGFLSEHRDETKLVSVVGWHRVVAFIFGVVIPFKYAMRLRVSKFIFLFYKSKNLKPKEVFFDYSASLIYILAIRLSMYIYSWRGELVCFSHDITYQALDRLTCNGWRKIFRFEYYRQKFFELFLLSLCDRIIVMSLKDKAILSANLDSVRIDIFNSYEVFSFKTPPSLAIVPLRSIAFFGALDRYENEEAIISFVSKFFPEIVESIPDVRFYVIGANPSSTLCEFLNSTPNSANISVTGYVDNPAEYLSVIKVGIAPLRFGAGVKIKVVQMLAQGMSVIASPVGGEGISHPRLKIAEAHQFSSAVISELKALS